VHCSYFIDCDITEEVYNDWNYEFFIERLADWLEFSLSIDDDYGSLALRITLNLPEDFMDL
jgi:hypothetical protein